MTTYSSPTVIWNVGPGESLRANRHFTECVGFSHEELAREPFLDWIHPEDRASLEQQFQLGHGDVSARHRTGDGDWATFVWRVRGCADGLAVLGQPQRDSDIGRAPRQTGLERHTTLTETLEAMVRIVEAKNPSKRCSILLMDERREHITVGAGPSLPAEYNAAVEGLRIGPMVGSCGTAAYWNIPVVVEDIAQDPLWKALREAASIAGVAACWSQPVATIEGEVLGAMALYDTRPCAPTESEMDGLEIAARMVALAIERHSLEEQLRQAAKMEAIGVLAGGIAHDFNNLLSVILGNAELAMDDLPAGALAKQRLEEIVAASMGATDFCNQMLAYAGRGTLSTETIECNGLVEEIGGLLSVALSKKATIVYELHEAPLYVVADRNQLRQVIMNLVTNASESLGSGEGRIVVTTAPYTYGADRQEQYRWSTSLKPGEYVELTVTDTGAGMCVETQAKIFDPFFTTKEKGRGLGLAAVQGIALGHGGAILVESELGEGTTFRVLFPSSAALSEVPVHRSKPDQVERDTCVLVVDDEPRVHRVLTDILETAGYVVIGAHDGQEAVDVFRLQHDSIDCVLLDLSMPKLDGEEVFREMVKIQSDVRVVLSSGFTEQEIKDRFREAGLDGLAGVIQKPTQMRTLLSKVAKALGTRAGTDAVGR
jgi:signal transduction histidine kinase/ActR/RegA family two-component response regulator